MKKSRLNEAVKAFEREFIIETMRKEGWSRKKTAQKLEIPISTLKYKMAKLGIYKIIDKLEKSYREAR